MRVRDLYEYECEKCERRIKGTANLIRHQASCKKRGKRPVRPAPKLAQVVVTNCEDCPFAECHLSAADPAYSQWRCELSNRRLPHRTIPVESGSPPWCPLPVKVIPGEFR